MIKVSVIIPVYNPGHYLHACIDSLLAQTLPAEEFEAILVDDGSTDESPGYLDEVAAAHPHLRVLHQENSGWPGKPRNVGLDHAVGEYVFFCDHDDWFAPDALERMYEFAVACGSDVVLPKMGGLGRPVPHHVFRRTVPHCGLGDAPVMDSLTPHKLFRRAFLVDAGIRFPEGKRRLEDHLFVVTAYLHAQVISIYADTTCYVHIRRADSRNAGFRPIDWSGYFDNLAEALDVVCAHTEPGPSRDRIFRRWLQVEMVNRLSGRRLLRMDPDDAATLLAQAHRIASAYFGEGVVALLSPMAQQVARAVIAGDEVALRRLATAAVSWRTYARVLQAGWVDGRLQISGTVQLSDRLPVPGDNEGEPPEPSATGDHPGTDPHAHPSTPEADAPASPPQPDTPTGPPGEQPTAVEPTALELEPPEPRPPAEYRFAELFPQLDPTDLGAALAATMVTLDLTERRTGAQWTVPAVIHRLGLVAAFTADVDPQTLAAGAPLPDGLWDLHAQMGALGIVDRRRVPLVGERRPGPVLPAPPRTADTPVTVAAYYTSEASGLALDVGLVQHKQLRPKPKPKPVPPPPPPPTFRRRASRALRRLTRRS